MYVLAAYVLVVLVWSTTPLAVKWSSMGLDPISGLYFRVVISALLGWVVLKFFKLPLRWDKRAIHGYIAANIGIVGCMGLVYWGSTMIQSGIISVLFGLSPIFSGLLARYFLGEKPFSFIQWIALLCCVAGLSLMFVGDMAFESNSLQGLLTVLLAVFLFSCSAVWVKSLAVDSNPLSHTVGSLLFSIPLFTVIWFLTVGHIDPNADMKAYGAILYLAIGGSLIGFVCYYFILNKLTIGKVNLINLLTPVLALLLGMFLDGESINHDAWIGIGIIIVGLFAFLFADRLPLERKRLAPNR